MVVGAPGIVREDLRHICETLSEEFRALAGKKLLITGGCGFLGYYLIQAVLHQNDVSPLPSTEVTVYDNYARGIPQWISELAGRSDLKLVEQDVRAPLPTDIDDFSYIIHAAGIASPTYYRKHPIETMDANVTGLRSLLDYCVRQKDEDKPVDGFLFFSSSEIYGDPLPEFIPTPETYRGNVSCTGPRACYDESKRFGETLCVNFAGQHGLPVKIARPFNNFGPGLKITDRRVLSDFARDVFASRDIVLLSDGSATRTFCYVADAVVGYYKILVKGRRGEAYNIGVEEPETSMLDLANLVTKLAEAEFDYGGRVIRKTSAEADYLVDNPNRRCPVIAKAKAELGYEPAFTLEEGLRRSLVWYSGNLDAKDA
jgi:UDP-glucuronate decarboxylase